MFITTHFFLTSTQNLRNERGFKLITSTQIKRKEFNSTKIITCTKNFILNKFLSIKFN